MKKTIKNEITFNDRCYKILCKVPKGKVTTYKAIAKALGSNGFRAVGNAMNRNENAPKVPCHRVVHSDGTIGGYALGTKKKIKLLESEGLTIINGKVSDFKKRLMTF